MGDAHFARERASCREVCSPPLASSAPILSRLTVVGVALVLAASVTSARADTAVAVLSRSQRVEWRRGALPDLLALPQRGEGWLQLAARLTGNARHASELRKANSSMRSPLRDVRVRVPWQLLRNELRVSAVRAVFPDDRRVGAGWEHVIVSPWQGEGESWWEIAELWCGDGALYRELRDANPELGMFPPNGARVLIPEGLLAAEFGAVPPVPGASTDRVRQGLASFLPASTPAGVPATPPRGGASEPSRVVPTLPAPTAVPTATPVPRRSFSPTSPLEYRGEEAIYRLRPGEALYSAVVVRFTGLIYAVDVNATAARLARLNGITDVTDIPIGYPIRIPFEQLVPEYLPEDHPRRHAWEKGREELAAVRRAIRAANLDGIHVVLDAGHGGGDTGAIAGGIWESTYAYDVMGRLRRVLERETRATVWTAVRDLSQPLPPEKDVLPQSRNQRLLVQPPYALTDSTTGVQLRWVLSNAILRRLKLQKVDPERVVFVSIHADSLHPSVRGLMVYVPARSLRPSRGPSPRRYSNCREAREVQAPRMSVAFRSRAEALSTQLANEIVESAERFSVPLHDYKPVRGYVRRGSRRFVPAVLRYNLIPSSVLVEICNLNNPEDRALLLTWRFRERLAHAIAAGLAEGFAK